PLEGQRSAGKVTEKRTIEGENGESLTASPYASEETTNYYPGGTVAGRPVPAGWYSRPWGADAMATGVWMMGYSMMFNAMFMGMAGVGSSGEAAAAGEVGDAGGDMGDAVGDMGDGDDMGDASGDMGDGGGHFASDGSGGLFGVGEYGGEIFASGFDF